MAEARIERITCDMLRPDALLLIDYCLTNLNKYSKKNTFLVISGKPFLLLAPKR